MADTALIFNILARGGKATAAQLLAVGAAADHVANKTAKLRKISLGALTGGLKGVSKFTLTAAKGLLAVGVAASAMNTVVQAGVGLAPMTGLLALLPGAALAAATALGTLKLATSGMKDAFKAAMGGDAKMFKASLKDLAPAARSVATELHKLRPELLGIRNAAQQALFAPLRGELTKTANVLVGVLEPSLRGIAAEFGLAAKSMLAFARSDTSILALRSSFGATEESIRMLRPALAPILTGFAQLATVAAPALVQVATAAGAAGARFGEWLQQIVASGKASAWIQNALATLKQVGTVLGNVGGILKSVFSAASAAGSGFLGVIGATLAKLNAFLKTAQGQAALQGIFQALAAIGTALGPIIGALVTGLGTLAAPISRLVQLIGPILTTAINALAPAFAALEPGLSAIFTGLGQAITALAPALTPLANALAQIGVAIGPVLPIVGQLIAQLVTALAPVLGQLFTALGPLAGAFVQLVGAIAPLIPPIVQVVTQVATALAPVFAQLAPIIGQVARALSPLISAVGNLLVAIAPLIPPIVQVAATLISALVPAITPLIPIITQLVTQIGGFLVGVLGQLMKALGPIIPVLGQVAAQIGTALLTVLKALAPALLQIIVALVPLLPAIVNLLPPLASVLVAVAPLLAILIQLASTILNLLLPPIVTLATFLIDVLGGALKVVAKIITVAINGIVAVFRWLYNTLVGHSIIPDLVNGILHWFGTLPARVAGFFKNMATGAINQAKGLLKWMGGLPKAILNALGNTGKLLYNAGKNVVQGLINGIWSVAKSLWNTMSRIVQGIRNMWPFSPAKTGPLSGGGSPDIAGRNIASMLAEGMHSGSDAVMAASAKLAGAAQPTVSPVGAGSAGQAAAGGAGGRLVLEVQSDGTRLGDLLVEVLQKAIRTKTGGNVQLALGGKSG